ncbi:MAG: cbb3-type cytochrome c oxidase subunit 3 [Bacteroidota bacterium]
MYKYLLQSVENIHNLAIVPLLVFFLFFLGVFIWALRSSRSYVQHMEQLPLERDPVATTVKTTGHE